ncbi:MAG: NADH-quinone oxidoreductase subunit NuoE [Pseudomonadota bacterium]
MTTLTLSPAVCAEIDGWLAKFPADRKQSAVIPALHIAQNALGGWLSREAMDAVADYLGLPRIAVYEVATFYSMYRLKPVGRHKIDLCTNISCLLNGSDELLDHLKTKWNLCPGQTTEDGRFTLREVECLAACGGAPAMQIGRTYYEHLTPEQLDTVLNTLE